ncbi:hypothetical protein ACOSQ2_019538 [Xanthoceras sorbifolium]
MYPFKRNKTHPEGSIAEEQNYDGDQANQMKHLSVLKPMVRLLGAAIQDELTLSDWAKIRWYVLNNCDEVYRYIMEYRVELEKDGVRDIEKKQEMEFYRWFSKRVRNLFIYTGCVINGIRFHTQDRDYNRRTQNCGVLVKGEHRGKSIDFYEVLKDINEVSYLGQNKVVIFKCDWWDLSGRRGIQIDEHNIISVNIRNIWYKNDPFVLACQTQQVFYLNDIKLGDDWRVVNKSQPRENYDVQELEIEKEDELDLDDPYQQQQSENIINIVEDIDDDMLCRNDMDLIDVDVNVEDQNDAIDNSVDDDNATDDVSFNYEGNEEDCISSNEESDCEEDYISSNNESDDT